MTKRTKTKEPWTNGKDITACLTLVAILIGVATAAGL